MSRDDSKKVRERLTAEQKKPSEEHMYFKNSDAKSITFKSGSSNSFDGRATDDKAESEELLSAVDNLETPEPKGWYSEGNWKFLILALMIIIFGAGNDVAGKLVTSPMGNFSFFLGIFNSVFYCIVYFSILLVRYLMGIVPKENFTYTWWPNFNKPNCLQQIPNIKYFIVMGVMDGVGILLGLISKPHISGDLVVLCPQTSVLFVMVVTLLFLGTKYTYWQIWSILFIMFGVFITLIPKFTHLAGDWRYILIMSISPLPNAISFVLKELLFSDEKNLDVFIVNSHSSLFQLLLQPVFLPLAFLLQDPNNPLIPNGVHLDQYLRGAFQCFIGDTPAELAKDCWGMPWMYFIYIFFNLAFNISILLMVKSASALMSFMALKAVLPVSVFLFYINWRFIEPTPFSPYTICGLVVILVALAAYRFFTIQKNDYNLGCFSNRLPFLEARGFCGTSLPTDIIN